jgi:hypothetical protein
MGAEVGGAGPNGPARTLGPRSCHTVQNRASTVVRSAVGVPLRILEALQVEQETHGTISLDAVGVRLDVSFVVS